MPEQQTSHLLHALHRPSEQALERANALFEKLMNTSNHAPHTPRYPKAQAFFLHYFRQQRTHALRPSVQPLAPATSTLPDYAHITQDGATVWHTSEGHIFECTLDPQLFPNTHCKIYLNNQELRAVFTVQDVNQRRLFEAEAPHLLHQLQSKGFHIQHIDIVVAAEH